MKRLNLKPTFIYKDRYPLTRFNKQGEKITFQSSDTIKLTVMRKDNDTTNLFRELDNFKRTKLRSLLDSPCYIDKVEFCVDRDYIDESKQYNFTYPYKRAPLLRTWTQGKYYHIAVMGELLNQQSNIKNQLSAILQTIFNTVGVVPLKKETYLNKRLLKDYEYIDNLKKVVSGSHTLFDIFLNNVSVTNFELAFGFHIEKPIEDILKTDDLFRDQVTDKCFYTGKGGYFDSNRSFIKRPIKAYDCSAKNNLKKISPKIEMTFTKKRYRDIDLTSFDGSVTKVMTKQKRRLKKELLNYVGVKNDSYILNELLRELLLNPGVDLKIDQPNNQDIDLKVCKPEEAGTRYKRPLDLVQSLLFYIAKLIDDCTDILSVNCAIISNGTQIESGKDPPELLSITFFPSFKYF